MLEERFSASRGSKCNIFLPTGNYLNSISPKNECLHFLTVTSLKKKRKKPVFVFIFIGVVGKILILVVNY